MVQEEDTREVRISKSLTQVLRHKALLLGLDVRADGYVLAEMVLRCQSVARHGATMADLQTIVSESNKQRFQLKQGLDGEDDLTYIRAVQGHSMKVVQDEKLGRRLRADDSDLPSECVHGTYSRHLGSILGNGLMAGGRQGPAFRNHVHFQPHAPGDLRVISGMRHDCDIAIWVDLREALRNGIPFFMSINEIIVTPGINGVLPKEYIQKVVHLKTRHLIFSRRSSSSTEARQHLCIENAPVSATPRVQNSPYFPGAQVQEEGYAAHDYDAAEVGLDGNPEWGYLRLTHGQHLPWLSSSQRGHAQNRHENYVFGMHQDGSGWFPASLLVPKAAPTSSGFTWLADSGSGTLRCRSSSCSR
jgi:2'-phosphotransferase